MNGSPGKRLAALALLVALAPGGPGAPGSAPAQCPSGSWTLFASTGDAADVELDGNVAWIAAEGGVVRIDMPTIGTANPVQRRISDTEGLVSTEVTALTIDGFGNVWVGTREAGASVFDSAGNHLIDLSAFDELLWGDRVLAMSAFGNTTFSEGGGQVSGDRVVISSADTFSASDGRPEGGGFVVVQVRRAENGSFSFRREGFATNLELATEIFTEPGAIWFGTAGRGVFRQDDPPVASPVHVLDPAAGGLLDGNVNTLLRAPDFGRGGTPVLWIATGEGLQRWDGAVIDTVSIFEGKEIFDLYTAAGQLFVLSERSAFFQDIFQVDLAAPFDTLRIPTVTCFADTNYVARQVGADASGRVLVATRDDAAAVWNGSAWACPPPLGPHSPTIADLVYDDEGTLWFTTGDKTRIATARGLGRYDGQNWSFRTQGLLDPNTTELALWPDGTLWLGSTRDASQGGLQRYFPDEDLLVDYYPGVGDPARETQGRNVFGIELDDSNNLWAVFGQASGGGLSVISWPDLRLTNYSFNLIFSGTTSLLRDVAFDSRGRIWISTHDVSQNPGRVYMLDTRGTIHDLADDRTLEFDLASEAFNIDLDEVRSLVVDSSDRVWLAGDNGLARGTIGPDVGGLPTVTWERVRGTPSQNGGRNPKFLVAELDWDENLWLATEQHGAVRITGDTSVWSWFAPDEGCPLPDPTVTGLFLDDLRRTVWMGTATEGIARIDLGVQVAPGRQLDPQPFPNPWRPGVDGVLAFAGIPPEVLTTIRIYSVAGELVFEGRDLRGTSRVWDGRNLRSQIVESGVYVVTAVAEDGKVYEGKVAVVR